MEVEFSNFEQRAIPKSCPEAMRAKIEQARSQTAVKTGLSVEEDLETLKKFASTLEQ